MSDQWEFTQEYLDIKSAFQRAQASGDEALCHKLLPRIEELESIMWTAMTKNLPNLSPYRSVEEGLRHYADKMGVPFPDTTNPSNKMSDNRFMFGISDGHRTVQIWPKELLGKYSIDIFEYEQNPEGSYYNGFIDDLGKVSRILSRWFVDRCSIEVLHAEHPEIPQEPIRISGPRITFS